jgi:hypothetical protein
VKQRYEEGPFEDYLAVCGEVAVALKGGGTGGGSKGGGGGAEDISLVKGSILDVDWSDGDVVSDRQWP